MSYSVEVDQSGRIEEFARDTIVAVSDGFTCTVLLTAELKTDLRAALTKRGVRSKLIPVRIFVAAIMLAIYEHRHTIAFLVIDQEYTGYDNELRSLVVDRMRALGAKIDPNTVWVSRIGKKSPAHDAAIRVMREQTEPTKRPILADILKLC